MMKNHLALRGFVDNLVIDEKPKNQVLNEFEIR
jgi:hypothetical protein